MLTRFDVAEHLHTREEMLAYLDACIAESRGDATFITAALDDIARAQRRLREVTKQSESDG